jgi:hypothetical protein
METFCELEIILNGNLCHISENPFYLKELQAEIIYRRKQHENQCWNFYILYNCLFWRSSLVKTQYRDGRDNSYSNVRPLMMLLESDGNYKTSQVVLENQGHLQHVFSN